LVCLNRAVDQRRRGFGDDPVTRPEKMLGAPSSSKIARNILRMADM
jgi:hypothetical protein